MTTLDKLGIEFERLCEELENATPGTPEYENIANNLRLIHSLILQEQKAETDNGFRNVQEDRAERQLILEEKKEERLQAEAEKPMLKKIDVNTIISGFFMLLGTGAILKHEDLHVITTKAMSFIPKPRFFK